MNIYILIIKDRHTDIEVKPYICRENAIQDAKLYLKSMDPDYEVESIKGWEFHATYSAENYVTVVKQKLNKETYIENNPWICIKDELPKINTRVDVMYKGVYELRSNILFWEDDDGFQYFGSFNEYDGKGAQPVTHWRKTI